MSHPFRCRCGAVSGVVEHPGRATHSRCYCEDCQAYARFLGREADMVDESGGLEAVQTLPKDVLFAEGREQLACVRLSKSGLLRWYAQCCNTPIGNTPATSKLPFVGLSRTCLEVEGRSVRQSFGPVRFSLYTGGARGPVKPKPFGRAGFVLWLIGNRLRARVAGGFAQNPFFDTSADRPIVEPRVLTTAEREQLRSGSQASDA